MGGLLASDPGTLSDEDFAFIRRVVGERVGIVLTEGKREMVSGRLTRQLRRLGLGFAEFCGRIADGDEGEVRRLINAVTTNVTSFFRENHHFEHLAKVLLPAIDARLAPGVAVTIWSAGCSSGEEPYSLAMTCHEALAGRRPVRILATDVDTDILNAAQKGVYRADRVEDLAPERLSRWFERGRGARAGQVRVRREVRELVTFRPLNLMGEWPVRTQFHVLFCRNVVIYFDKATQRRLFDRFANQLLGDGHLFLGHSESLLGVSERFDSVKHTIYRKTR